MTQATRSPDAAEGRTVSRRIRVLAWTLAALALAPLVLILVAPVLGYQASADDVPWFAEIGIFGALVALAAFGAVITSRQPRNPIGSMFLGFAALNLATIAAETFAADALSRPTDAILPRLGFWASNTIGGPVVLLFLGALLFLFPDGRPASRRWRIFGRVAAAACGGYLLLWSLMPGTFNISDVAVPVENPLGVDALRPLRPLLDPLFVVLPAFIIASALSLVLRFRRSRGVERQQLKWLSLSGVAIAIAFVLGPAVFWREGTPEFAWPLTFAIAILTVPIACGMAILRYRLYDIDRIISRTVSYAIVTALLGSTFALIVLLPPLVVGRGGTGVPDYVIAVATLVVAALFRPVRRRVQDAVDHRFNRKRYHAEHTIEAFTTRLREQIDIEVLGAELRTVVGRTMQPSHVTLWVRAENTTR